VCVFYADRISKMATTTGHRLALDPMGKCSNAFFSETTNMIKAKLTMTCGGSHLGFLISIKNRGPSNDHSWAVWFQRRSVLKHFPHRVQC
jgi:hypothetical protein